VVGEQGADVLPQAETIRKTFQLSEQNGTENMIFRIISFISSDRLVFLNCVLFVSLLGVNCTEHVVVPSLFLSHYCAGKSTECAIFQGLDIFIYFWQFLKLILSRNKLLGTASTTYP
jgi:hypothetical protein